MVEEIELPRVTMPIYVSCLFLFFFSFLFSEVRHEDYLTLLPITVGNLSRPGYRSVQLGRTGCDLQSGQQRLEYRLTTSALVHGLGLGYRGRQLISTSLDQSRV